MALEERLKRTLFALYDQIIDPADAYAIINGIIEESVNRSFKKQIKQRRK